MSMGRIYRLRRDDLSLWASTWLQPFQVRRVMINCHWLEMTVRDCTDRDASDSWRHWIMRRNLECTSFPGMIGRLDPRSVKRVTHGSISMCCQSQNVNERNNSSSWLREGGRKVLKWSSGWSLKLLKCPIFAILLILFWHLRLLSRK